jgi:hypothetical protein
MGRILADLGPQGEESAAGTSPYLAGETTKYLKDVAHVCPECERGSHAQS